MCLKFKLGRYFRLVFPTLSGKQDVLILTRYMYVGTTNVQVKHQHNHEFKSIVSFEEYAELENWSSTSNRQPCF